MNKRKNESRNILLKKKTAKRLSELYMPQGTYDKRINILIDIFEKYQKEKGAKHD